MKYRTIDKKKCVRKRSDKKQNQQQMLEGTRCRRYPTEH